MDVINKQFGQIRDLFVGMTPGSRLISGLLLGLLCVSLAFLVVGSVSPDAKDSKFTYLFDGRRFSQTEMQSSEGAFGKAGLSGHDWIAGKLRVPAGQQSKFAAAILENKSISNVGDVLQNTVDNLSPIESGKMMDLKMMQSRASNLQKTIAQFSGLYDAAITVNERLDRDPKFYDKKKVFSASVTVWPLEANQLDTTMLAAITRTVKSGLGITNLDDISIINGRVTQVAKGTEEGMMGGPKSFAEATIEQQHVWEKAIRDLFPDIPGLIVKTSVALTDIMSQNERVVEHGEKPTEILSRQQSTNFEFTGADRASRPGYVAQWNSPEVDPNRNATITGDKKSEKTKTVESTNALNGAEIDRTRAPFVPKTVSASIRIPLKYIKALWEKNNSLNAAAPADPNAAAPAGPTALELANIEIEIRKRIKESVANLIGDLRDMKNPDATSHVNVDVYPDDAPIVPEIFKAGFMTWLSEEWKTLSLLAIVFAGLALLWGITRPRPSEPIVIYEAPEMSAEMAAAISKSDAQEDEEKPVYNRVLEPFNKAMRSLQQEVSDLVVENPEAAASVIRQWIGNVAAAER